ncbi:MAG: hypothetical protein IH899_18405 [Planctomycetes bacterium]|nr:hypothetical protein [Planctomycetota bacterium]
MPAAPPKRKPGTNGRPRKRGKRLATPEEMLKQRGRRITGDLYGRSTRLRLLDVVARVFRVPGRDLRIVATEALAGGRGREVVLEHLSEGGRGHNSGVVRPALVDRGHIS